MFFCVTLRVVHPVHIEDSTFADNPFHLQTLQIFTHLFGFLGLTWGSCLFSAARRTEPAAPVAPQQRCSRISSDFITVITSLAAHSGYVLRSSPLSASSVLFPTHFARDILQIQRDSDSYYTHVAFWSFTSTHAFTSHHG